MKVIFKSSAWVVVVMAALGMSACSDDVAVVKSDAAAVKTQVQASGGLTEGVHYKAFAHHAQQHKETLPDVAPADVLEFFSYSCSHCQHFAPVLQDWHHANSARMVAYVPVAWSEDTKLYARMFYLVQGSPEFAALHHELFSVVAGLAQVPAIGDRTAALSQWAQSKGFTPDQVLGALEGDHLNHKLVAAELLARQYEISGTPTLIAQGRYKVDTQTITSYGDLLVLLSRLLEH